MPFILTELGFRAFYGVILYIGLYSMLYLTLGLQLEFLTAKFTNYCDDFCFESLNWQWLAAQGEGVQGPTDFEETLSTSVHQSKSWSFLSIASMGYFNEFLLHNFVILNGITFHLMVGIYIWIQMYGFLLPGCLPQSRQVGVLGLGLGLCYVLLIHPTLALYVWAHLEELNIEPLDSELRMINPPN